MDEYWIAINDIKSNELGVVLQKPLSLSAPVADVTTVKVAGRNGDLHYFSGSYKNRTAKAEAYVYSDSNVEEYIGQINSWLFSSLGYLKLESSGDPDHFLMARISNGADVESRLEKLAPFEVKFDCKPQRFLNSGLLDIVLEEEETIENPTMFDALPWIYVQGTGAGTLTIGTKTVEFLDLVGEIVLDTETNNAYTPEQGNLNHKIRASEFPIIAPGENIVTFTGGVSRVIITPRWWEL